jgi:nuclear pore complex protein Nup160
LDYIRHNDTSVLPVTNSSITEIAFRLLESYLKKLEKPFDSTLHRDVTLEILANKIALPRWLVDSYKKINVAQLIHCYLRYGDWEEATDLVTRVIDAALGRVPASEFDPSIHKVDAFEPIPVIPYTVIDMLCHQMELRFEMDNDPEKERLLKVLNTHINDYCIRVIETRQEREAYLQDFAN